MGSAICWPEQFEGEREIAEKIWADADQRWPNRDRRCGNGEHACKHCPICGYFMTRVTIWWNEIGGLLAVVGQCKKHGEQCVDSDWWSYTDWSE